jgi:hypothetical protein
MSSTTPDGEQGESGKQIPNDPASSGCRLRRRELGNMEILFRLQAFEVAEDNDGTSSEPKSPRTSSQASSRCSPNGWAEQPPAPYYSVNTFDGGTSLPTDGSEIKGSLKESPESMSQATFTVKPKKMKRAATVNFRDTFEDIPQNPSYGYRNQQTGAQYQSVQKSLGHSSPSDSERKLEASSASVTTRNSVAGSPVYDANSEAVDGEDLEM